VAEVSIHKVTPGSILAGDVRLPGGAILVREGVALTDRQITFLKHSSITTVFIQDQSGEGASAEVSDAVYAERCGRLEEMFEPVQDAPHMAAIRDAARTRLRLRRPWE